MQDARWLFFDLGNTVISEERAWERRIQRLASSLERYGRRRGIEEVRAALREASEEFALRLITRAIEKLIDDLEYRKLILTEARYDKELESTYEGAEQTLRKLSSRYRIGVIANQPGGTEERLAKWGLMPFISIVLTAAAASLGMIPIAPEVFWGPMAYAIIGGLFVATLLTLLFLPALYVAWFRVKEPRREPEPGLGAGIPATAK